MVEKQDTRFGRLVDLALKHKYGEGFIWDKVTIENQGEDNFVVTIDRKTIKEDEDLQPA